MDHLGPDLARRAWQLDVGPQAVREQVPDTAEATPCRRATALVGDRDEVDSIESRQLGGEPLDVDGGSGKRRPAGKGRVEKNADRARLR
jgi:hypothetical protein